VNPVLRALDLVALRSGSHRRSRFQSGSVKDMSGRLRRAFVISVLGVFHSSVAFAQADSRLSSLTGLCLTPAAKMETLVSGLEAQGWSISDPASEGLIDAMAWNLSVRYLAGDSGGETLASIYDLQLRTARGFAAKKDIPGSMARFLTQGENAMMVLWRTDNTTNLTEIECRVSAGAVLMQDVRQNAGIPSDTGPDFTALDRIDRWDDGTQRYVDIVLLNRAALSQQINQTVTVDATVNTYQSFGAQE
jgi:hypothetical protein